jgi:hypothetical protein
MIVMLELLTFVNVRAEVQFANGRRKDFMINQNERELHSRPIQSNALTGRFH